MTAQQIVYVAGVAFSVIFGYFTARSANRREAVYGGPPAQAAHYVAAAAMTGLPLTVLATAITSGLLAAVSTALVFLAFTWGGLLTFAYFEGPAREAALAAQTDRGWTEEDARSSGL